jgi:demethylspheroidene O-methyltransferase
VLLHGAAALGLVARRRGKVRLTRRGAALLGAPGVVGMIRHHRLLYADLADPAAFFRGGVETRTSRFWPYVLGKVGSEEAARYSALMADSQTLVAEETLAATRLRGVRHLMDVGGGTGAFLAAVARRYPRLTLTLTDLPPVAAAARERLDSAGLSGRIDVVAADFRAELPAGADAISLVRVLYDHDDATVGRLLARVRRALPPGGRLIVSEPMLGTRAADTYFAAYTMAMGTGRTRSPGSICALLEAAGFGDVRHVRTRRPFITSVVEGRVADAVLSD